MNTFEELGLARPVLRAIADLGFEQPTPIQEQAIPVLLSGTSDLVALAQTGTGKTAAFGLPLASLLDFQSRDTQALILCPTRELCMQITRDLQDYTKHCLGAHVVAIYGGASIETQIREVRKGPQIIVGTPGRMVDMIERGVIDLSLVDFVVLDEADEMLHMGFKDDLDLILSETSEEKQTWLFSATMPEEVARISRNYMKDPAEITVSRGQANANIEHVYYVVHQRDKYLALKRIADFNPDIFAIVFCRTKAETQQIADQLIKDGYNADALHGDLSQAQRDYVMKRYRSRSLQLLVATDVAARGIDVDDVTHVIQYALPDEPENYTHRSGRTARAGKTGVSIAIINMKEMFKIRSIEKMIKTQFRREQVPGPFEVCERQLLHLIHGVHQVKVDEAAIEKYLPAIAEELGSLSREEIIKRFVSIEFNRFLEYYRNAPDLNADGKNDNQHSGSAGVVKLYFNLGKMDEFHPQSLRAFIAETAGVAETEVPWADVKGTFSLVEVRIASMDKVLDTFKRGINYRGRRVRVESRGNKEVGIPRTRLRSEKDNSFQGGGDFKKSFKKKGFVPKADFKKKGKKSKKW